MLQLRKAENKRNTATPTPEPDDSKGGTQQFRVQNQKQNLSPTFCDGTVHTDRCQCVVLSRLAFSATTLFPPQLAFK